MPVDAIETYEAEPIIALQQLPEAGREEIIFQTQEEVVGEQEIPYEIPVPVENDVCVESSPGPSKRQKKGQKRRREVIEDFTATTSLGQKWEQKQVQIKTLEGEFSVTMWSSGVDEGKCQCQCPAECPVRLVSLRAWNNMRAATSSTPQYETDYNSTQQYVQVEMPSPDDQQFVIYTS
ncbi:Transcriptional repressor protein YY1 [Portunus trituberculatus]|uniref:Transcriptional repressor protein YY1 n=1 Tax=Portunus trituberculatus TaxID=210409 RepID=A0A5B7CWI2_PORTR|nr:Transcriptional repressor protein YY1 [Portunus trituberculatus]